MTLLRQDLIRDLLFLWSPADQVLHTCMSVGLDVCGHPSIVHGGFTSGASARARVGLADGWQMRVRGGSRDGAAAWTRAAASPAPGSGRRCRHSL